MDLLGTFIDNHDNARFLRYPDIPPPSITLGLTLFFFSSLAATHRQWHDRLQALPERHHLHPHGPRHPHHLRTFTFFTLTRFMFLSQFLNDFVHNLHA
jgi:hypothetical protein